MDNIKSKIEKHQKALSQYISQLAEKYNNSLGNTMNYQAVIDKEGKHFQLLKMGWHEDLYSFSVLIHLDINIETGNIWIQQNNTEIELEIDLAEFDIFKENLVLGFRPAYVRALSDYAAA